MTKTPQFLIFGDQSWPVESFAKALPEDTPVSVWIDGRGWVDSKHNDPLLNPISKGRQNQSPARAAQVCSMLGDDTSEAVAIVGFEDLETSQKVAQVLKAKNSHIKILQVGAKDSRGNLAQTKRLVAWSDLISPGVDTEIYLLGIQDRVRDLRALLKEPEKIAILLQDDPDPDGLAAALALRKVLGRKAQTAAIVSFGTVTRPENVAMARLLDIEILTIDTDELKNYDKVVMVDCQPSFFKGRNIHVDVILDHHPHVPTAGEAPEFADIRVDLGAISTLLTQYLRAADIEISQRLATALLYGIKSDTLTLNREVSEQDLEAFVYLYRRINGNILRRIERPELPLAYLSALRVGLKHLKVEDGIAILPLDRVEREEWIPQAADFALQFEGVQWALGCGIFQDRVIISGRNCGYLQHCGDLFKFLFDKVGCAGGHRTMAKAIIPVDKWTEHFGKGSLTPVKMASQLIQLVESEIENKKANG